MGRSCWGYLQSYFQNFEPTNGFKLYVDEIVCRLQEMAPDGSTVVSMVRKMGRLYSSRIDVITKSKHFKSSASASDAHDSLEAACAVMRLELSRCLGW